MEPMFQVGDTVVVRQFDEMTRDDHATVDADGDICFRFDNHHGHHGWYFWRDDKDVCGRKLTVKDSCPRRGSFFYRFEEPYDWTEYDGLFENCLTLTSRVENVTADMIQALHDLF